MYLDINMTKDDEALLGGVVLVGGALALRKINELENQMRIKDQQINALNEEIRRKDYIIAQKDSEIAKLKGKK